MKNVGKKIRERRQELGLSGTEVAENILFACVDLGLFLTLGMIVVNAALQTI